MAWGLSAWRVCAGLVLGAVLAFAPAAAYAQTTVVAFTRSFEEVGGAPTTNGFVGRILFNSSEVQSGEIRSVSIVFPGETDPRALQRDSLHFFFLTLPFASQESLDTGFPEGTYTITVDRVTGPDSEFEVGYSFRSLTGMASPSISSPVHESEGNLPDRVEFRFAACGSACAANSSRLFLELRDGPGPPIESDLEVGADVTSFTPSAPLAEGTAYTFRVEHRAVAVEVLGDDEPVLFASEVVRADQIDFTTSGLPPAAGGLCFVVNDPSGLLHDPDHDCIEFDDPEGAIYDPSGTSIATTIGDLDVEYDFELDREGRVVAGVGHVDLDRDGTLETSVPVHGRIVGRRGRLHQRIRFRVRDSAAAPDADIKVTVSERIRATGAEALQRTTEERLRGREKDQRLEATESDTEAESDVPLGWRIDFEIDGIADDGRTILVSGGVLRLGVDGPAGLRVIPLKGKGRFSPIPDRSKLSFKSFGPDRGIRVRLSELRTDDADAVTSVQLNIIAIGQKGRVRLR